jgi:hypothetical protein
VQDNRLLSNVTTKETTDVYQLMVFLVVTYKREKLYFIRPGRRKIDTEKLKFLPPVFDYILWAILFTPAGFR